MMSSGRIFSPLLKSRFCFQAASRATLRQRFYSSINCNTKYNICFVRHGQSTWNRDNRFIGWTDTPLTEDGVLEARVAGQMLLSSGMLFDDVHTVSEFILFISTIVFNSCAHREIIHKKWQSLLRRCIRTTNLVLMEMGQVGDILLLLCSVLLYHDYASISHQDCILINISFDRSTFQCINIGG